jgi:tetratricopeptide (TPR) repeat protein
LLKECKSLHFLFRHGALYKVLGEIESRQGNYQEARICFNLGISMDPHYAPLYHETALFEARLGNIEVCFFYFK